MSHENEFLAWVICYYIRNPGGDDGAFQRFALCETPDIAFAKLKELCDANEKIKNRHEAEGNKAHRVYFLRPIICRVIEEIV